MPEKDPYIYRIKKIIEIIDGDTIDADIDLGFDISLSKRIRLAGIDTPESRTKDLREKKFGLESKKWIENKLKGQHEIIIKTELPDSTEKYGRIIGRLYVDGICINDCMIEEGYAWTYDGGTKYKDFNLLTKKRNEKSI